MDDREWEDDFDCDDCIDAHGWGDARRLNNQELTAILKQAGSGKRLRSPGQERRANRERDRCVREKRRQSERAFIIKAS